MDTSSATPCDCQRASVAMSMTGCARREGRGGRITALPTTASTAFVVLTVVRVAVPEAANNSASYAAMMRLSRSAFPPRVRRLPSSAVC
jgi:hypothetical protein